MLRRHFDIQRFAVSGTSGNDTLQNTLRSSVVYGYGGADSIYNYGGAGNDSISITGGSYKKSTVGNDIIVSVSGGKVTLSGAKGKSIKFYGDSDNETLTAQDVIKKFTAVLDTVTSSGVAALDQAVNIASGAISHVYPTRSDSKIFCRS